ncbi:MAG: hypothetical protein K1X79_00250 [Oligoflexia bacterium]|nr:hypothetical protein [Oligoflexia bacterium]
MTLVTVAPDPKRLNRLRKAVAFLPIAAGLTLLPLLLVGYVLGVNHPSYDAAVALHICLLLAAAVTSISLFVYSVRRSALSPVLLFGSLLLFLILLGLAGSVPITSRDALIHHLAVPRWWIEKGHIIKVAWHEWSFYPMLINLAYTSLLGWGLEFLTPYYHALYLLVLCGTVASFVLYKSRDHDAAALSFLMTLSMPAFFKLASIPLVDLALALYCALAFCHFIYWIEGKHRYSHLLYVGAGFGLALGCKYNGMLAVGLFAPCAFVLTLRSNIKFWHYLAAPLLIGFCILCLYAPWALRNFLWTGNPIYPLFNSFFAVGNAPEVFKGFSPLATRALLYNEPWYLTLLIPLRMLAFGQDDVPDKFDGVLSPILILFVVALWRMRKDPATLCMGLYCAAYFIFAILLNSARVRYLAPIFGPLIILTALAVWDLGRRAYPVFMREIYLVAAFSFLSWGDLYAANVVRSTGAIEYWASGQTREEYLRDHIPEYRMIEFMNSALPAGSRTYLLNTGNRFYYYNTPIFSGGYYSAAPLIGWIKSSASAEALKKEVLSRGISHIMTNTSLTRSNFYATLSTEEIRRWNDFQTSSLRLIQVDGGFSLWAIE